MDRSHEAKRLEELAAQEPSLAKAQAMYIEAGRLRKRKWRGILPGLPLLRN